MLEQMQKRGCFANNNNCPDTFMIYLDPRDNGIIEENEKRQDDGDTAGYYDDDSRDTPIHIVLGEGKTKS
jgi:hypothetical protein